MVKIVEGLKVASFVATRAAAIAVAAWIAVGAGAAIVERIQGEDNDTPEITTTTEEPSES